MKAPRLRHCAMLLMLAGALAACDRRPAEPPPPKSADLQSSVPPATAPLPTPQSAVPAESSAAPTPAAPVTEADREFIAAATGYGLAEMEAGRLVAAEGGSAQVKAFAEKVHQDHAAINVQLARLASARKLTVAEAMPESARSDLAEMRKLSGAQLDTLFLARFTGSAHQERIAAYERAAREAADPDIRAFAQDTLAVLRGQAQTARELQVKVAGAR